MKRVLIMSLFIIVLMAFGIPLLILSGYSEQVTKNSDGQVQTVRVLDIATGRTVTMPLEEYLVGVVAAEMPANFEEEALKAQAVAARTYTLKRMFAFGGKPLPGHPDAEVCTNPAHCQAWLDSTEQRKRWGTVKYFINTERIRSAVEDTKGVVITYIDDFIDPVYHGSCGGKGTEDSEDVWSTSVPYLRGVSCNDEDRGTKQQNSIEIGKKDLVSKLAALNPSIRAVPTLGTMSTGEVIKPTLKSPQGRLKEAEVYGQKISGTDFRKALGLTSTLLVMQDEGTKIKITSIGKGHAVGLCQYGANGMALAGKSFKEILLHYYTGTSLKKLKY